MSSSNFGPLNRDHFSKNIHIKGAQVIDSNQNITGNNITCHTLTVTGNATLGNITSNHLIITKIVSADAFIGSVYGNIFDEHGSQLLTVQQPPVNDPNVIATFVPGSNVDDAIVPSMVMPTLGPATVPMSTNIKQDSVEHLLYYNHIQLRNEVVSLRTQVVQLLEELRIHGLIKN